MGSAYCALSIVARCYLNGSEPPYEVFCRWCVVKTIGYYSSQIINNNISNILNRWVFRYWVWMIGWTCLQGILGTSTTFCGAVDSETNRHIQTNLGRNNEEYYIGKIMQKRQMTTQIILCLVAIAIQSTDSTPIMYTNLAGGHVSDDEFKLVHHVNI